MIATSKTIVGQANKRELSPGACYHRDELLAQAINLIVTGWWFCGLSTWALLHVHYPSSFTIMISPHQPKICTLSRMCTNSAPGPNMMFSTDLFHKYVHKLVLSLWYRLVSCVHTCTQQQIYHVIMRIGLGTYHMICL
jgi:hypothetical protein